MKQNILELLIQVPRGRVTTYKALAIALGDEIATRSIGRVLHENKETEKYPCYRVVHSNGMIGGYALGIREKEKRLKKDGVVIKNGKIQNFEKLFFNNFKTDYPLKKLREEQLKLRKKIVINKPKLPKNILVAGIDVSYRNEMGKCGYVAMNENMKVVEKRIIIDKVDFSYIPTYFSYRELPLILKTIKEVKNRPDVLMIDGNGLIHPRRMGIATHAGVILDMCTIGVAKSLLFGRVEDDFVKDDNETLGKVIRIRKKPIYVSIGNKIDLETCEEIVRKFSRHKIPEPLRLAHILSKF